MRIFDELDREMPTGTPGDISKFNEEEFFYFVDRKKDDLRRRGENISSFEMETAFAVHPDLAKMAVHTVRPARARTT